MDELRPFVLAVVAVTMVACAKDKTPESVSKPLEKLQLCGGQVAPNRYIVEWEDGTFSVEKAASYDSFKLGFVSQNLQAIKEVEPDIGFRRLPDATESLSQGDDSVETQANPSYDYWGQELIGMPELWAANFKGDGVKVGIVDSFVDLSHESLLPQIAYNKFEIPDNGIDDDGNGYIDDYTGQSFVRETEESDGEKSDHGTHVSGIVAGAHFVGSARGVAPDAKIIAAPFIGDDDVGTTGGAILALQYAVDRGAKVINMSWGGTSCEPKLKTAIETLGKRGVLFTVAAGNGDPRGVLDLSRNPVYPAAYDTETQITVSATSSFSVLMDWSFYSAKLSHIGAPGDYILSSIPMNRYKRMPGTSMAAPFVAGAAAILWGAFPEATVQQVKMALLTGVDVPQLSLAVSSHGRLNVKKALDQLRLLMTPPAP